jgi:hypothetical protein
VLPYTYVACLVTGRYLISVSVIIKCIVQMTNCSQDLECQLRMLSVMSRYWYYRVAQKYLTLHVQHVASSVK